MLLRAILMLAILAALGSSGVVYYQWTIQIPALVQQREAEKLQKEQEASNCQRTLAEIDRTAADLKLQQQWLADTQLKQLKAVERVAALVKQTEDLQGQIAAVNSKLQLLAEYRNTGLTPAQITELQVSFAESKKQIAALVAEKTAWSDKYSTMRAKFQPYLEYLDFKEDLKGPLVYIPSDLRGHVSLVDPKWDFIVLDVGDLQGVIEDGEMLVSRHGQLLAKVVVRTVEKDHCIADIVHGWKLGEVLEGDVVTPAVIKSTYGYAN